MFVTSARKNAFLTSGTPARRAGLQPGRNRTRRPPKKQQRKITSKDIPDIYPIGSEIMVQVTKGPIGTKGARVTTNVSWPDATSS